MAGAPHNKHCILELHGCPSDRLNDLTFIGEAIQAASREGYFTLLEFTTHQFHPQGATAIALLAESHLAIHTWPESQYAAVDIFTCGPQARPDEACQFLIDRFGAQEHVVLRMHRGGSPQGVPTAEVVSRSTQPDEASLCQAPS